MSPSQQQQVLSIANSWLGTPYHHRAMVRGAGVDCALFLYAVYLEAGLISPFSIEDYPPDWMMHRTEERYLQVVMDRSYEVQDPQPADVVMYKFGRCFSHGGIIVDPPRIIHSVFRQGVVYALVDEGKLKGRERSFWRVKG